MEIRGGNHYKCRSPGGSGGGGWWIYKYKFKKEKVWRLELIINKISRCDKSNILEKKKMLRFI